MMTETIYSLIRPDDVKIMYGLTRAEQMPGQRAIVLLHGLASNMTRWTEFIINTQLKSQWDIIRIDLRGHGDSKTCGRIGLELWSDDLVALLDSQNYAQAVLIGHSLGAQVALHFGSTHASRVQGLALIDPVFYQALQNKWQWLARYHSLFTWIAQFVRAINAIGLRRTHIPLLDLYTLDKITRQSLLEPALERKFIRRYRSIWADLHTFHTAHYLQELAEMFRPMPLASTIQSPVLVLLSTGAVFTDIAQTQVIAQGFPHNQIVTVNCHHWPLTEKPDEVRQAIEIWCKGLLPDNYNVM